MDKRDIKIGLALSGGGSRAIAFHLGCLKALHDLQLLKDVAAISCVSGGSVIGATYAYSTGSFKEFESLIRENLKKGFVCSGLFSWFNIVIGPMIILNIIAIFVTNLVNYLPFVNLKCPYKFSLALILEKSFKKQLFKDIKLNSKTRDDVQVVFNSCELQTKTAFRFGNTEIKNWKFGNVEPNRVDVSKAVLCSAAYPVIIPAIETSFEFTRKDKVEKRRMVLTDGGIYENLGLSVLLPFRKKDIGLNAREVNFIIACDAGNEIESEIHNQNIMNRLTNCFESVMRRTQANSFSMLHELKKNRAINGFILAYLTQNDQNFFPYQFSYADKATVGNYPTDFYAMDEEILNALVERGRSVTSEMIFKYL